MFQIFLAVLQIPLSIIWIVLEFFLSTMMSVFVTPLLTILKVLWIPLLIIWMLLKIFLSPIVMTFDHLDASQDFPIANRDS